MKIAFPFIACLTVLCLARAVSPARADVSFSREIAPILLKRCTGCHGERANQGGYRAHNYQSLMKSGGSGQNAIVAGKPEQSKLFQLITSKSEPLRMPKSDDPLAPEQIELIRKWIVAGARFDGPDPAVSLKALLGVREHPAAPVRYRAPVPVLALAFAPGGKEIAAGGYNEVTVWNATTGALSRRLQHLPQRIQALAFSRDGHTLLIGGGTPGEYGEAALVDPLTGERKKVLDTFPDIVLAAAFSQDGRRVAAGGADNTVRVYDVASGKRLWSSGVHSDWVTSVSFSYDGRFVMSAGKDMTVKVNDAETGVLFTTYNGHNRQIGKYKGSAPVYAVVCSPASLQVYSAGGGRWIQVWDPIKTKAESGDAGDMEERFSKQSQAQHYEHGFGKEVYALCLRGGQLFAASADGAVKQFDTASMKEIRAFPAGSDWLFSVDYDPEAHRVAAGSFTGDITIWDSQTGQSVTAFKSQPGGALKSASRLAP